MNLNDWVIAHELLIRVSFFFGVFAVIALWEVISPRRTLNVSKPARWLNNLALVFLNALTLRILFPAAAIGVALLAKHHGWGLFNVYEVGFWPAVVLSVIIMDFVIYLQHVMVHSIPLLWRLHRVHHADLDYDVTTGARFHTLEIILSMLIKFATIILLGPSVMAVVIFEVLLNATAMFNHGNIYIPQNIDRVLRLFVVTPDMHRIHHSVKAPEANSNFGFSLPWWDRLFGTYLSQPDKGHIDMKLGIEGFRNPAQVERLPGMMMMPFAQHMGDYAINRRWQ